MMYASLAILISIKLYYVRINTAVASVASVASVDMIYSNQSSVKLRASDMESSKDIDGIKISIRLKTLLIFNT